MHPKPNVQVHRVLQGLLARERPDLQDAAAYLSEHLVMHDIAFRLCK